jgi:hypothetical protein
VRRAEEVALVVAGRDPYDDPDMTYPPSAPAVFVPLVAPFGGRGLRIVWLALNLGALGVVCGRIVRLGEGWSPEARLGFGLVAAASKPVRLTLGLGQFSLLPLALVLGAESASRRGREGLAGLLLGVALIKPTMVVPFLLVFAAGGRWRAVVVAGCVQAAAFGAVAAWLGADPSRLLGEWLGRARSQSSAGLIDVPSVAERIMPGAADHAAGIAAILLIACGVLLVRYRDRPRLLQLAVAGCFAALFTYHRPYDLVLLLPALGWLVETGRTSMARRGIAGVFALLLIAPNHPAVVSEAAYDAVFIPACYGIFALMLCDLVRGLPDSPQRHKGHEG